MDSINYRFSNLSEALQCLSYWKKQLRLKDWDIKLHIDVDIDEDVTGKVMFCTAHKAAIIYINKPENYGAGIIKYDAEVTLVHELMHCKFALLDDTMEDEALDFAYYHSCIEDLARALVMSKRSEKVDQLRNF